VRKNLHIDQRKLDAVRKVLGVKTVSNAMIFDAALGLDVRYFPAVWHTFNAGHILATRKAQAVVRTEISSDRFRGNVGSS